MAASEETSIVVDDPSDWPADFRELRVRLQIIFALLHRIELEGNYCCLF